jgi:hypothetical protein
MADIILGKLLVDLVKLLLGQVQSWRTSKKQDASATAAYIADIADKLDKYVLGLIDLADPAVLDKKSLSVRRDRYELDQTLENLGYTLKGKVDDRVLNQLIESLTHGKVPDGMLIPALGDPEEEILMLTGTARSAAIDGLVKAAGEFRAIADSLAAQASKPLPAKESGAKRGAAASRSRVRKS